MKAPQLARAGFQRLEPATPAEVEALLPPLPVPPPRS